MIIYKRDDYVIQFAVKDTVYKEWINKMKSKGVKVMGAGARLNHLNSKLYTTFLKDILDNNIPERYQNIIDEFMTEDKEDIIE